MPLVTGSQVKIVAAGHCPLSLMFQPGSSHLYCPGNQATPQHFEAYGGRLAWPLTWSQGVQQPPFPLSHRDSPFIPEGSQVSQVWFAFGISILVGLSHVLVLPVLGNGVQDLLGNLSGQRMRQLADSQGYSAPLWYIWMKSWFDVLPRSTYGWMQLFLYERSVQSEPEEFVSLNRFWSLVLVAPINGFVHWSWVWTPGQD